VTVTWLFAALGFLLAFAHVGLRAAARIESVQRGKPHEPPRKFSEHELLGGVLVIMLVAALLVSIGVGQF
jgi:hypothetical protein